MATMVGNVVGGSVDRLVRWVVIPVTSVIPVLVRTGALVLVFGALWVGIGVALVVEAQRLLQLALPDEAPGSNHVGNDVYVESLFVHFALQLRPAES